MKILVLSANYPNLNGGISLMYVHTRNKYYKEKGIDVNVINFKAEEDYKIDGINVYSLKNYKEKHKFQKFDILICHAPNIKNHYMFLKKYEKNFKRLLFVFHGHEVLNINKVYPKSFDYVKEDSILNKVSQEIYDKLKLRLWKSYYLKLSYKSHFMFVSEWMYSEFLKWTKVPEDVIKDRYSITYNCVGKDFETEMYDNEKEKEYDFITIRGNIDGSKYCIDIVSKLAKKNPKYKFVVIGKGLFFKYNKKPENLVWIDKNLSHKEVIEYLNMSRYALMPTRTDAQGLMMCEMATFGIPLITSNIPVCKEVFEGFENIEFIENDGESELINLIENFKKNYRVVKNTKYFNTNTSENEIKTIYGLMEKIK